MADAADDDEPARRVRGRFLRPRRWKRETEVRLDTLVALLDTHGLSERQSAWLRSRWRMAILNMLSAAVPQGRRFQGSQVVILFGGLAVPVLASFNAASASPPVGVRYAVLVVSLVVALATALQQAYAFRENWQLNWQTAGALEAEAWSYLHGVAPTYTGKSREEQSAVFIRAVETLIVDWNEHSVSAPVSSSPSPSSVAPAKAQ